MRTVHVATFLTDKVLVTRESAHALEEPLAAAMVAASSTEPGPGGASIAVDFEAIQGVSPSFLDELLWIFGSLLKREGTNGLRRLLISHPPTRLSLKFEAVARGHGMEARPLSDGSWILAQLAAPAV